MDDVGGHFSQVNQGQLDLSGGPLVQYVSTYLGYT